MVKYLSIDNLQALDIGHVSDNQTSEVSIDCSAWRRKYPALTEYNLFVTNPQGMIYPANTVMTEDGKLLWKICDADTSIPGVGRYQIIATGRYGDRKASKFADLTIAANMPGMDGAAPPDPSKAWVGDVIAARREAENAARAATDSAEAVAHPPIIGENGNWWLWDNEQKTYVDSGFDSRPDAAPYTLPTASETVKGGVKVGKGLAMEGESLNAEVEKADIDKLSEEIVDQGKAIDGKQPKGNYLTEETDPTVPAWAKQPEKPIYAIHDIAGLEAALAGSTAGGTSDSGLYRIGKNKIDPAKILCNGNGDVDASGNIIDGSFYVYGYYVLTAGITYTLSKVGKAVYFYFYDTDNVYAGAANNIVVGGNANTRTFVCNYPYVLIKTPISIDDSSLQLQVEEGNTATEYESYRLILRENVKVTDSDVLDNLLLEGGVGNKYLTEAGISAQKLDFTITTRNLLDPLACTEGYLSSAGNLIVNSSFFTSDFIPVSADDVYVRCSHPIYMICYYDAQKVYTSREEQIAQISKIPVDAAYARVTFKAFLSNAKKHMIYTGNEKYDFVPYRIIPQTYMEQPTDHFPEVSLVTTKDLYVAYGVTVDIHAQSITKGIDVNKMVRPIMAGAVDGAAPYWTYNNHIEIVGGVKPDVSFPISGELRWGESVYTNISVHNVPADAGSGQTKKVLLIGDSKTDANVYTQALLDLFANDSMSIELLGTRGNSETNRHEGRSGWSAENYCLNNAWRGVIEDSPFYNPSTETFDFAYYMAQNGYDGVDYVFINLGTNDTNSNFIDYYHQMIDGIRAYDSNIIIGLWVPAPFATFGGYTHKANDNQTFLKMEKVIAEFDTADQQENRIYVVPTHMNLDTEWDYGWRDVPYTATKPEHTYRVCTDQIHEVNGYYKLANVIFGYIKHFATLA